jgi:hypothetical protein
MVFAGIWLASRPTFRIPLAPVEGPEEAPDA